MIGAGTLPVTGDVEDRPGNDPMFEKNCVFSMPMDVTRNAKFYTITVGPLGDITLGHDEIANANWVAAVGQ